MSIYLFLRIEWGELHDAIGPHRANMLEAIERFGTVSAAAPAVDLSYRQLWRLVQILNSLFDKPMIAIRRSGRQSGACLTPFGKTVLARIREMQRLANETLKPHFREFEELVGIDPDSPPPYRRYGHIIDPATLAVSKKRRNPPRRKAKRRASKRRSKK